MLRIQIRILHVFGPPGSGHGSGSFPFLINVLSGLKKCQQNKILKQNFSKKYFFFRLKIMCLWARYKKNIKKYFFCILKINEERSRIRSRIHLSEERIRGSGSAPNCPGSPTLLQCFGQHNSYIGTFFCLHTRLLRRRIHKYGRHHTYWYIWYRVPNFVASIPIY